MKKLVYILFLLLLVEGTCRFFMVLHYDIPFFKPGELIFSYYPGLKDIEIESKDYRLLVLGGSVLYPDTLDLQLNGKIHREHFCDLKSRLDHQAVGSELLEVVNLSKPAHNSLDSWYKYKWLENHAFDAVFFYHGINDTRANNCPTEVFDDRYEHIQFYHEVGTYFNHPEIQYTVIPWLTDKIIRRLKNKLGRNSYLPREHFEGMEEGIEHPWLTYGADIKSARAFEKNLSQICELAIDKQESVILSTYAYYITENYSLNRFQNQQLDYGTSIFPIELYGLPKNVEKGIVNHNSIILELAATYQNPLIDLDGIIPKNAQYFNDICHLTDGGCDVLSTELLNVLPN